MLKGGFLANRLIPVIIIISVVLSSVLLYQNVEQLLKKDEVKEPEPIVMSDTLYIRVETDKDVYLLGENITASFWVVNEADKDWNATFSSCGIWSWAIMTSSLKNITHLHNYGMLQSIEYISVPRNSSKHLENITMGEYHIGYDYFDISAGKYYIYAHFHYNWNAQGWEDLYIYGGKLIELIE